MPSNHSLNDLHPPAPALFPLKESARLLRPWAAEARLRLP